MVGVGRLFETERVALKIGLRKKDAIKNTNLAK